MQKDREMIYGERELKQLNQLPDVEIINLLRAGKKDAFAEIIKRYNQRLYRIALSYGVADDDCDEVLQSAYIAAYEKLHQFRGEAKFSTWLTRILINECLMLKRQQKRTIRISEEQIVTIPAGDHLNPQEMYMTKERKKILEDALLQLPEKYKSVFILKEIEGMSIEEVSEVMTISKINVKVRLHRARTMLKNIIGSITDVSNLFTFGNDRCDRISTNVMEYIKSPDRKPADN